MGIIKLNKKGENKVTQQNNSAEKKENKKLPKAGEEIVVDEPAKEIELCELAKQDAGFVEELENLRTTNETVYRRNDRTCRKIITAKPTRYLDKNGKYRDISNRLMDNGNEIENEANSFKVKFNKDATNGKIFDLQKGTKVVSLSAVNSGKTRSHSCGCKCELCSDKEDTVLATLEDGTEIEYVTLTDRIKENIIINEKRDSYEYNFTLNIGDLAVEEGDNNSLLLKDAQTGELQFTIPAPYMYDANKVRSNDVSYEIDVNGEELQIKVIASADFINAEERVLPVIIDPQIVISTLTDVFEYYTETYDTGWSENDYNYNILIAQNKYLQDYNQQIYLTVDLTEAKQNGDITSAVVRLMPKSGAKGQIGVRVPDNGGTIKYSAVPTGELNIDIPKNIIASTNSVTIYICAHTTSSINESYVEFFTDGDNAPKLIISYVVNEEKSKKKIELGDRSKVILDLSSGESVVEIADIIVENNLPLQINHIHKLGVAETEYGLNWRLNLNKKLCVSEDDTSKTTRYIYTDELGDKYLFEEKYYYLNGDEKVFISNKSEITTDINGKLFYNGNPVSTYQSCKGYTLISKIDDFVDSELIEQRQDEQAQLEDYIKQYEPTLKQYVKVRASDGKITAPIGSLTKSNYENLVNGANNSNIIMTANEAYQLQSLYASKAQYTMQKNQLVLQKDQLDSQIEQLQLQKRQYLFQKNKQIPQQKKELNNSKTLSTKIYSSASTAVNLNTLSIPEEKNEDADNVDRNHLISKVREKVSYANAVDNLNLIESSDPDQETQLTLLNDQIECVDESLSNTNNQLSKIDEQITFADNQLTLIGNEISTMISQAIGNLSLIKENYLTYFRKKAQLDLLLLQTPVNYIKDENGIISGFNYDGDMVLLCDAYGNYVNISYDNDHQISEIYDSNNKTMAFEYANGLLQSITDNRGRKVTYSYTSNKLNTVTFADGDTLTFKYASNLMRTIESSNGLQTKLTYDDYSRVSECLTTSKVNSVGKGITEFSNSFSSSKKLQDYSLSYGDKYTSVTDYENNREEYTFDSNDRITVYKEIDNRFNSTVTNYDYDTTAGKKITSVSKKNDEEAITTTKQFNEIDLLVSETEDWQTVSDTVRVKTETSYAYDSSQHLTNKTTVKTTDTNGECSPEISIVNYSYNAAGNLILTESYVEGEELTGGKNYEEKVYDDNGNVIKTIRWNSLDSSSKFYSESEIAENGQTLADKDETGETSAEYEYVSGTNVVNSVKYSNGSKFAYGRNPKNFQITSITQNSADGEANQTDILYENGLPVEVKSGNTIIDYTYDYKGRKTGVKVNGETQSTFSYYENYKYDKETESSNGIRRTETLADNTVIEYYSYCKLDDETGRMEKVDTIKIDNTNILRKNYNSDGLISMTTDYLAGTATYTYDDYDNITQISSPILNESFTYNEYGELIGKTISNAVAHTYSYAYKNNAARDLEFVGFGNYKFYPLSDVNGRNTGKEIKNGENKIAVEYITYRKVGDHATNMPATVWFGGGNAIKDSIKYKYDSCGNICQITENGHLTAKYTYDSLNRLIREDNKAIDKTVLYTYDNNGNIVERCEYDYTSKTGEELTELECEHFSYDYNGDKLISYNGESFVYNNLGNPTTYRNKAVTWQYGKYLASYNGTAFTYDGLGRRVTKGGITFTYDNENNLIKQSNGLEYIYDNSGVVGVIYGGEHYFYRKDAQGNIIAILDSNGAVVVKYVYDAWGNHGVLNSDGTDCESGIGILNPFRYRGYYYDIETGLYYLQTRYYDPEVGRFISQDSIEYADPETINGLNLYSYCGNNPTNYLDPTGNAEWWQWLLFGIGVALVVAAAVVLSVASGGAATGLIGAIAVGAAKGALIGAAVGSVVGIAGGAIYAGVTGADMGQSILSGFLMGFGIGAIAGAVIGGAAGGISYTPSGLSRSAINSAVKNTLKDSNKMSHIMQTKHNLPNSIKEVGKLMKKTMINGTVTPYKSVSSVIWDIAHSQVTYTIIAGAIKISDMWIFK